MVNENFLSPYPEAETLISRLDERIDLILEHFNRRSLKLFDLPTHQRIFLFILTRAMKSYAAIVRLCRQGYGQDVAMLLRSLLDNLITVKYILHDRSGADDLTKRFVAYKWIIFKRSLEEEERKILKSASEADRKAFLEKKDLILKSVEDFKKSYQIISDRALLTWSGKTVRDMAQKVSLELMEEYDETFRLCSRFSHPSILGDQEYVIQDDQRLVFSAQPSGVGIVPNLKKTIRYMIDLLLIVDELFEFDQKESLSSLLMDLDQVFPSPSASPQEKKPQPKHSVRDSIVSFKRFQE